MTAAPESNPWRLRAQGGGLPMVADPEMVRTALALFADPAGGCEVMALKSGAHRTLPGSDLDGLCRAVAELPGGIGVYFRVNPVPVGLAKPATNGDVARRRWLYLDVDPVRAEGHADDPATDAEKEATGAVCAAVIDHLTGLGWPAPVVIDSGNGFGVMYRCDLPNDKLTGALVRRLLADLAGRFDGPGGTVDKSVHNANRLAKVPGTWARKGRPSDDRPHRPCRLLSVPAGFAPVTADLLARAAGGEAAPAVAPEVRPSAGRRDGAAARRYLQVALSKLVLARPGERNNALNRAAYTVGGLVGAGLLDRAEAEAGLVEAGRRLGLADDPGCGERGIRDTVARGLDAGATEPWEPAGGPGGPKPKFTAGPQTNGRAPEPEAATATGPAPLTVSLAKVTPLAVEWLVRNRIPRRFITVFAGRTAVGKSFVALDLVARLTRGGEIPLAGGECFEPGGALVLSEDSPEYVIAPRLIDAGADLARVHCMTWKAMNDYHLGDTGMLGRACDEVPGGVRVVLIDPPTNFLEGADEHKNSDVRQLVMKVVEWAMTRDLAVIFILHVNKSAKGVEALNRVMGSVAWVTTARVAHSFTPDPNDRDRCLWVPMKNNLGPVAKALAYRIPKGEHPILEWIEEVDTTADDAMSQEAPRKRRDVKAREWLVERFRERLEWESEELFERARQEGISRNAIFDAKTNLRLPRARRTVKENGDVAFVWWVGLDWLASHEPQPSHPPGTGTVGTVGTVGRQPHDGQ